MMKYEIIKTDKDSCIQKTDDDGVISFIPINEANSDYQAYLASLENGTIS